MTKFTIEDLRDIAYRGSYDDLARELALQLIASMEQDPEGWQFLGVNGLWVSVTENGMRQALKEGCEVRPLYAAPQLPQPAVPDGLNPQTTDLVLRFSSALAEKLYKAERKYGRSTDWMRKDWRSDCLQSLWEHIEKGDPRDVAAYCAFMWHHGWVTTGYDRNVHNACRAAMLQSDGTLTNEGTMQLSGNSEQIEPVSNRDELPLDYLQGHKDGLEWAAQLAEANHPQTGDWLYDDPIDLARAIRKGPDMPPAQPVADSEPVAYRWNYGGTTTWRLQDTKPTPGSNRIWPRVIEPLYRHAQQPVVPETAHSSVIAEQLAHVLSDMDVTDHQRAVISCAVDRLNNVAQLLQLSPSALFVPEILDYQGAKELYNYLMNEEETNATVNGWNACRAAMLAAAPQLPGSEPATVPGKWIPVSERLPEESGRYWCYVEEQNSLGKSHYQWNCSWNECAWSDKALTGRVTHWMPLPTALQETNP